MNIFSNLIKLNFVIIKDQCFTVEIDKDSLRFIAEVINKNYCFLVKVANESRCFILKDVKLNWYFTIKLVKDSVKENRNIVTNLC